MEELNIKLLKIQQELKAPKDLWNDFSKFSYRSAESILEAVKPLVHSHDLTLTISDDLVCVGEWNYVKATVTISEGNNSVSTTALAREQDVKKGMDTMQITGSASSYARKYALNGLFAIDDTKDADAHDNTQNGSTEARQASKDKEPSVKQIAMIRALASKAGLEKEAVDKRLEQIKTSNDASEAIKKLQEMTDEN